MTPRVVMVQGTGSDAGKSALVTGLCRVLHRRGLRVAPFKPQNMALNSAVTEDGGEIGRAQAVQARACGLAPHSDMNPVLLKPSSDRQAQLVIGGRVAGDVDAAGYPARKRAARSAVLAAFRRLAAGFEVIVVEGAGSPAEINLRADDIANMGFAEAVDCPVLLVADIDRGGVFASLTGTLALLSPSERARVRGFVINRFRGDRDVLDPGLAWLEARTGVPVLGVLPYLQGLFLEAEDALAREPARGDGLRVVVPALPRISNHTDFDPLRLHPQVDFRFIGPDRVPPPADLVILPGSKHTRADLDWLRRQGWVPYLQRHLRYGGRLLGICGGFQMLGRTIRDPGGADGSAGASAGLALLEMDTTMDQEKRLARASGRLTLEDAAVEGYEIHCGRSTGPALGRPLARLAGADEGAVSDDGQIAGSCLHGLFDAAPAREALLRWAGLERPAALDLPALREAGIDRLADAVEAELDWARLEAVLGLRFHSTQPTCGDEGIDHGQAH